jgi:hypothetical protein
VSIALILYDVSTDDAAVLALEADRFGSSDPEKSMPNTI